MDNDNQYFVVAGTTGDRESKNNFLAWTMELGAQIEANNFLLEARYFVSAYLSPTSISTSLFHRQYQAT